MLRTRRREKRERGQNVNKGAGTRACLMGWVSNGVGHLIARYLGKPEAGYHELEPGRADALAAVLKPGDVLLIEGNSHIAGVIKYLTDAFIVF